MFEAIDIGQLGVQQSQCEPVLSDYLESGLAVERLDTLHFKPPE
jgi:hypothetical protein